MSCFSLKTHPFYEVKIMFSQIVVPAGHSLLLSFLLAAAPILVTLIMMGVLRRPAWQSTLGGLTLGLILAVAVWGMPVTTAFSSLTNGMVFAIFPVMWIAISAIFLFNVAKETGRFDAFRAWILTNIPNDRRIILIVIGFCFSSALEGVAGFGSPIAITSALLIMLGFPALEAISYVLIFNAAAAAYGALGIPVTVLGSITGLPAPLLASTAGLLMAPVSALMPFYVMVLYAGWRSVRDLWPVILVASLSFTISMVLVTMFVSYNLTDILAPCTSLILTIGFLHFWKPKTDAAYAITEDVNHSIDENIPKWHGWIPWVVVTIMVVIWSVFHIAKIGAVTIHWPGLDNKVFITLYHKPYAALWTLEPLGTGTAIFLSALITAALTRASFHQVKTALLTTAKQGWLAVVTVSLTIGFSFLMNYSGMTYTLGFAVASTGAIFPLVSVFLGWIGVFLTGSDTACNALFGNLQVSAAHQLNLDPTLFASVNAAGGGMGKTISPQNIATGVSVTTLKGQEGVVLARTIKHSLFFTCLMAVVVVIWQHLGFKLG